MVQIDINWWVIWCISCICSCETVVITAQELFVLWVTQHHTDWLIAHHICGNSVHTFSALGTGEPSVTTRQAQHSPTAIRWLKMLISNEFDSYRPVWATFKQPRPMAMQFLTALAADKASCTDSAMKILASGLPPNLQELRLSFEGCNLV